MNLEQAKQMPKVDRGKLESLSVWLSEKAGVSVEPAVLSLAARELGLRVVASNT